MEGGRERARGKVKVRELKEKRRREGGGSENEEISFMGEICLFFSLLYRRST